MNKLKAAPGDGAAFINQVKRVVYEKYASYTI